jgi:hypothetical protein
MVQANSTAPVAFVCKDQGAQAETESKVVVCLVRSHGTGQDWQEAQFCFAIYMRESYRLELFVDK